MSKSMIGVIIAAKNVRARIGFPAVYSIIRLPFIWRQFL